MTSKFFSTGRGSKKNYHTVQCVIFPIFIN
jgi:hypothetical protein